MQITVLNVLLENGEIVGSLPVLVFADKQWKTYSVGLSCN